MKKIQHKAPFERAISCDFNELWRYNIHIISHVLSDNHPVEVLKHDDTIAEVGAELTSMPNNYSPNRDVVLQTKPADTLITYIYIVPHTLPFTTSINDAPPFELNVEIKHDGREVHMKRYEVNQWSGENITISCDGGESAN